MNKDCMLENMYYVMFPDTPLYLVSSWHKGNMKGHSVTKWHFFSVIIVHA